MKYQILLIVCILLFCVNFGTSKGYESYNLRKGKKFLAKKAEENDILKTESGILYKYIEKGYGSRNPDESTSVKVAYEGFLLSGKKFDGQMDLGLSSTFPLGSLIDGWQEILKLMYKGDIIECWIPHNLAYGLKGSPPKIGPNEVLHFKLHLQDLL